MVGSKVPVDNLHVLAVFDDQVDVLGGEPDQAQHADDRSGGGQRPREPGVSHARIIRGGMPEGQMK